MTESARQRLEIRGEYPPGWDSIGDRVRDEAGNRCIRCGHPQGDTPTLRVPCDDRCAHPRDGKLRILTVHHFDGDKSNCKWWNLMALCQGCHLTIQGRVIPERPWLFEFSPWIIPYVCGFFASFYGGVEISREEANAEPDRWLSLNPAKAGAE